MASDDLIEDALRIARDDLVIPFEGYHRRIEGGSCCAYPDPGSGGDPWTIGFGSTGPDIRMGVQWTREEAEERLTRDLKLFSLAVLKLSPATPTMTPRRLAALISFSYNCGTGNYRVSTLRKRVNDQDWLGAQEQIVKWNKAAGRVMRGLTIRRMAEARYLS